MATLPPPSSKTASPEKDKIKDEGPLLTRFAATVLPNAMALGAVFETALYLFLLTRSDSRLNYATQREFEAVQRLKMLKNWHVIAAVLALAGGWFRRWSFATLGRFFTVRLKKLIAQASDSLLADSYLIFLSFSLRSARGTSSSKQAHTSTCATLPTRVPSWLPRWPMLSSSMKVFGAC